MSGHETEIEFLPGVKYDENRSFLDMICDHVRINGPKQYLPIAILADAMNRLIAGTSVPWAFHKTTEGLLYKLGLPAEANTVYTLSSKILSLVQAGLEQKYDSSFNDKVATLTVDDIKDEEVNVIYLNTTPVVVKAPADLTSPEIFWDVETQQFVGFPDCKLQEVSVGYQAIAKETSHKVPMRYIAWRQFCANLDNPDAFFTDGTTVIRKTLGKPETRGVSGKLVIDKEVAKWCVKEVRAAMDQYNAAVWEYIKPRSKTTEGQSKKNMEERFKGSIRGIKGAHTSRKNRKTPKEQSSRSKVGLHGTGKANPRTKSQGARAAGKKKAALEKALRQVEEALNPTKRTGRKVDTKTLGGLSKMMQGLLWCKGKEFEDLEKGVKTAFSASFKEQLKAIADEKDLFGDSRNFIPLIPIHELMLLMRNPPLYLKTGAVFALEAQKELSDCSDVWCVTSINALPGREQGLRCAQAMLTQAVATDVLLGMIDDPHFSDNGQYPGWNSPFEGSEFTSISEGTVVSIHRNHKRPPVVRLPRAVTKGTKVGTCVNAIGSSLIAMEGEFLAQTESVDDSPKLDVAEAYAQTIGVTSRKGRGGWVKSNGTALVDDNYAHPMRMRNPQQKGHWALLETRATDYSIFGAGYGPDDIARASTFMREGKGVIDAKFLELVIEGIYDPGHPEKTEVPLELKLIDKSVWEAVRAIPIFGNTGTTETTTTPPSVLRNAIINSKKSSHKFKVNVKAKQGTCKQKMRKATVRSENLDTKDFTAPQAKREDYRSQALARKKANIKRTMKRKLNDYRRELREAGGTFRPTAFRERFGINEEDLPDADMFEEMQM